MESVLTNSQKIKFGPKVYTEDGVKYRITAKVRYDDQCGNGHNTFAITGDIDRFNGMRWVEDACGCIHDEIEKHFPELRHLIKWHLCSSDGPMHYVANTMYHAREHGPKSGWLYFTDVTLPVPIVNDCMEYGDLGEIQEIAAKDSRYTVKIDEKTAKVSDLDAARSCAIWPDATPEQLSDEKALKDRLPGLLAEFRADIEALGFTF